MQVEAGADTDLEDESLMKLTAADSNGFEIVMPDITLSSTHGYSYNRIGYYVVNYEVVDSYGKTSLPFEYAIEVKDTRAPTITGTTSLINPLAMGTSISLTDTATLGITVTDSFDTNPKLFVQDDDGFDQNKPGTYTISYDASDDSGNLYSNEHIELYYTYTITVTDQEAPIISGLKGETVTAGTTIDQAYIDDYTSRGLTVADNYDTTPNVVGEYVDVTGAPIIPDTSKVGNVYVDYDAVDESGNKYSDLRPIGYGSKYQFTISVVDKEAPTIMGSNDSNIDFGVLSKNFDYLSPEVLGLTITDNVDKNPQLILASDSDIYDGTTLGTYNMKYLAVDNANNTSAVWNYAITVIAQPPIITTSGDQTVTINPSITNEWIKHPENVGIVANGEDGNFDGVSDDLTSLITIKENGGFDSSKEGSYPITYEVVDPISMQSATATINVMMKEDIKPRFFGQTKVDVDQGDSFDFTKSSSTGLYLSTDKISDIEEGISEGIVTVANLGTDGNASTTSDNFIGDGTDANQVYEIKYTAIFNGYTTTQIYTINVVEQVKPLIIGKNSGQYLKEDPISYNSPRDMGMIAISSRFTDLTSDIVLSSITDEAGDTVTLNEDGENPIGTYTLIYNVTDPYTHIVSDDYIYKVKVVSLGIDFDYTHPEVASDEKGMLSYVYDDSNEASEIWQGGYNANLSLVESRLTAKSGMSGEDVPVSLESTGGYETKNVGNYVVTYAASDIAYGISSNFIINLTVVDTLPPTFIGTTSYDIIAGQSIDQSNIKLSITDAVDGHFTTWSDVGTADSMTITDAYLSTDTSIKFDMGGNNVAGDYIMVVNTQDKAGNMSSINLSINVTGELNKPPIWQENFEISMSGLPTPFYINSFESGPLNNIGHYLSPAKETISGDTLPWTTEFAIKRGSGTVPFYTNDSQIGKSFLVNSDDTPISGTYDKKIITYCAINKGTDVDLFNINYGYAEKNSSCVNVTFNFSA